MKRAVVLGLLIAGGFVAVTTVVRVNPFRMLDPIKRNVPVWSGPDVARSAGLSTDELNNIDIYRAAHEATVNITSTVLRRGWFMEIYPERETGSGFFINDQGLVLTNNHVVSGSSEVRVTLPDRSSYPASILARDPQNDLALLKVTPKKPFKYLRLGDSDKIQIGQKVLAIGNPFGLEGTLTTGIVSSSNRTISDENGRELEGMIQTDAAINPGNSGGPLLDSLGNVIGINTAIYGRGGSIGIGFAMPVNRAKAMLDDYQSGKKYARPRLGVEVLPVEGDLAEALGLPRAGGLLVQGVAPGSAAEAAGLRGPRRVAVVGGYEIGVGGDLITEVEGRAVERRDAIARALSRKRAGDSLELTLFRNGRVMKLTVTLGAAVEDRL
ncbi:MAG: trypsin-like peptidase domain-containing protein [Bryobacteraceae bacterium]|nr:trypsin-like peptidase domain-containing protein [Bryobacteraceae bacterium]